MKSHSTNRSASSFFERLRSLLPHFVALFAGIVTLHAEVIPESRLPPGGRWDRSKVGVAGGIPNFTDIYCNVKESVPGHPGLVAKGDGVTDDTDAIGYAIWECPNGKVVYIPEGTYLLKNQLYFLSSIPISKVLRGAGPTKTKLKFDLVNGTNCLTFMGDTFYAQRDVVAGFQRGSTKIVLTDASGYAPGQVAFLFMGNGADDLWSAAQGRAPEGCIHQTFNIVAVDAATNTITVDRPIYYDGYTLDRSFAPYLQMATVSPWIEWCGIEDLALENVGSRGGANIFFSGARNCWVKNVESSKPYGWNIRFQYSRQCEVRQSVIHDGWNGGGDTMYGVGFYKMNCDNLVEDNIFYHCRHSMITEYGGQGNVFGYNYSFDPVNEGQMGTDFLMGDMIAHGGLPMYNLYEGNVVARLSFDYELGGNRKLTAFRNWVQRKALNITNGMRAADIARNGLYNNIVGNIFLTPGQQVAAYDMGLTDNAYDGVRRFGYRTDGDVNRSGLDQRVVQTTLWHMNWDFQYQGSVNYLDPSVTDTNLQASYYYTSKPSWWTEGLPWPAIGPDLSVKTAGNPAYIRWQQRSARPGAPTNLRVVNP